LLDIGTELVLIVAAGAVHALEPEFPAGENADVGDVEGAEIAAGAAVFDWRVVAVDGHPIEGETSFTYAPATVEEPQVEPGTTAEAAPADEPQADDPAPSVESEPVVDLTPISAEPISEEPESEDLALWAWVLIGLALVGLVV